MIKSERQRRDDSADDSLVRHVARNAALAKAFAPRSTCSDSAEAANYREMQLPLPLSLSPSHPLSLSLACFLLLASARREKKGKERKAWTGVPNVNQ